MTNQTQNKRDSFIFYRSFYDASKCLKTEEKAQLFDAICSYALDEKVEQLDGTAYGMFQLVKPQLDANRKRFNNGCIKKQKGSKKEAKAKQTKSKIEANVNVNVNPNVNENLNLESKSKSKLFIKPTIDEIKNYCLDRKNNVNAESFSNYYEARGWKLKGIQMKDWKACVRTWEQNNNNFTNNNFKKPAGMPQPQYDDPDYYKNDGGWND
jgi:hypothetical protein